ncbi:hypothetical protein LLS1_18370 [Leifsonia sp. LS1]|uniref:hypothetical protein n=1 Tax=Leifsonia sp. LS1 TaxID=2828483 RepID=UPI001CFCFBF3|nr:hypothetical protein [Leifsonia sp. LS1]GIT80168.1 hypothetical protein LLS1_18370 [Leifsonia sp. LS1]
MPDWLLAIIIAAIAASGGWLTWLTNRRSSDKADIRDLRDRMDELERRDLIWRNYAQRLRDHIYAGSPPPPPEWPTDLYAGKKR